MNDQDFTNLLRNNFAQVPTFSTPDVSDLLTEMIPEGQARTFALNNVGNMLRRACDRNIIVIHGRRAGYSLVIEEPVEGNNASNNQAQADMDANAQVNQNPQPNAQWESFFHLIANVVLCDEFETNVLSLPKGNDPLRWSNPDMLMIGKTTKGDFALQNLQAVHNQPTWNLTSVELKYGLNGDRRKWLDALMETSINGGWANQNVLVYMDSQENNSIDVDCMDFARASGIGIYQISLIDNNGTPDFKLEIRQEPRYRSYLTLNARFSNNDNDGRQRAQLRDAISGIVSNIDNDWYFNDSEIGNYYQLFLLIRDLRRNLGKQTRFNDFNAGINTLRNSQNGNISNMCSAIYNYIPQIFVQDVQNDNWVNQMNNVLANNNIGGRDVILNTEFLNNIRTVANGG